MVYIACWLVAVLCVWAAPLAAQVRTVSADQEKMWLRHLIPLPHEISIGQKMVLSPNSVRITTGDDSTEIEQNAADELRRLLASRAGSRAQPGSKAADTAFEVLIGVAGRGMIRGMVPDSDMRRLRALPNREQAYLIRPVGKAKLVVTALHPKGVYHGARTLHQLLEARLSEGRVEVPLARVTDWPDLEERGLWNFPNPEEWVPWMAALKLNYGKMARTKLLPIERGKKNGVVIETELYQAARRQAFHYQPYLIHFNFLHASGLFRAYPELAGEGDTALAGRYFAHKTGNQHRAPKADHPLFQKLLAEWLGDFAAQGVEEVSCWLSERPAEDEGRPASSPGQEVSETRALLGALREVRKTYPSFGIRIFLSTVQPGRYYRVMAETPSDIKIERACATKLERIPHLPRDLFRNPMLDHYSASGRWIASYDVPITANARVDTPEFMVPESSAHRVRDYLGQLIERKIRGAYGMMAWGDHGKQTCGYNIHALAEFAWNHKGRSEKEFSIAWATREGYKDPERVGEWAELMGPVEFDVYDSDFPIVYSWGKAAKMIEQRERPYLGEGIFRYYSDREDFDRKIAACDRALEIARGFENPYLADETRVVRSYVRLAKSLYEVAELVAMNEFRDLASQARLRGELDQLAAAGEENASAIRQWRRRLGPQPWHQRVHDAIQAVEATVNDVREFVSGRYFY